MQQRLLGTLYPRNLNWLEPSERRRNRERKRMESLPSAWQWAQKHFVIRDLKTFQKRPIVLFPHQRRILHDVLTPRDGRLPYNTVIYSSVKKSGKTTIGALIALYLAFVFVPEDGELYFFANSQEQVHSRMFKFVRRAILYNPELRKRVDLDRGVQRRIVLKNGTELIPMAAKASTAAGGEQDASFWDELWAYTLDKEIETWYEMVPPPTRPNSLRIVTTYAGWEDKRGLLWDLYQAGLKGERLYADGFEDPQTGEFISTPLPVFVDRASGLYMYWDSGEEARRMPWQTSAYYRRQWQKVLRGEMSEATFRRLHLNLWGASESVFVSLEAWKRCKADVQLLRALDSRSIVFGVDIGIHSDHAALVGVAWAEGLYDLMLVSDVELELREKLVEHWSMREDGRFPLAVSLEQAMEYARKKLPEEIVVRPVVSRVVDVVYAREWVPEEQTGGMVNPDAIFQEILRLRQAGVRIAAVWADPWQFAAQILRLKEHGISVKEFPQGPRRVESDSLLRNLIYEKEIRHLGDTVTEGIYDGQALRDAVVYARGKESERGIRIAKGKGGEKVDLAVALSMAVWGLWQQGYLEPPPEETRVFVPFMIEELRRLPRRGIGRGAG